MESILIGAAVVFVEHLRGSVKTHKEQGDSQRNTANLKLNVLYNLIRHKDNEKVNVR